MWRPASDPDFPWTGLVIGGSIVGVWYWCTDQYIVQRALAARNITVGRRGTIFGAFLKITPLFLFLIPGIIAYAMTKTGQLELESADQALPALIAQLLPPGIRGLVAAGLLAALMSSLASVFNSCSTLFTVDVYKKLRPKTPEINLVRVGRIATAIVVLLGIAWIPIMAKYQWRSVRISAKCTILYSASYYRSILARIILETDQCAGSKCYTLWWVCLGNVSSGHRDFQRQLGKWVTV